MHVPDTERSGRPHYIRVRLFQAECFGALAHSGTNTRLRQRRGRRVEIPPLTPPQSPPSHTSVRRAAPATVLSETLLRFQRPHYSVTDGQMDGRAFR